MLTRACTWWSFLEVDAQLRATLRDLDDVRTDLWDVVKHARKDRKQRRAGGYCDQAEVVSRAAVLSAGQQLRLRPHNGLRGALGVLSTQPNSMTLTSIEWNVVDDNVLMSWALGFFRLEYAAAHPNY